MSTHLFTRSSFSLLDSTIRIPSYVSYAKENGFHTVVLTDHNNLFGAAAFIRECKKQDIKGIVGLEIDVLYHEQVVPFVLLAKNTKGYYNLIQLSSIKNDIDGEIALETFKQYADQCVVIAYGEGGYVESCMISNDDVTLSERIKQMKEELPPFYFALSYQESNLWREKNLFLKRIAARFNIETVALNKIYYLKEDEYFDYRILSGIREDKTIQDASLSTIKGRYYLSQKELERLYDKDDLDRTDEIAGLCTGNYELEVTELPKYPFTNGVSSDVYLEGLCKTGLKKRLNNQVTNTYASRLKYELDTIIQMHFEDYFLIVFDFIRYAKKKGINIGPGRGSVVGSLVAYCLGITDVDPIENHLLFERFLNPQRISYPDIDTDIPDDRRDEVIQYVYETYGKEHIANIITFGTLGAKQVIRDVGKVLNMRDYDINMVSKLISKKPKITLKDAYNESLQLQKWIQSEEKFKQLFYTASRLEGLPRHMSTHAAGIVMSKKPLRDIIPTIAISDNMKTSQYTADFLEERGLIKMDFLGLRNLTTIDNIVKSIKEENPSFSLKDIPYNDPKVFQLLSKADTVGVFQLESEGIKKTLKQVQPSSFSDIAATLALYRPASMANIPSFVENKKHPEKIHYVTKDLEPVLKETYGIMAYQEQAMLMAEIVAGFSLGKADILRKAFSKKNLDSVLQLKNEFIYGCLNHGYSKEVAEELFSLLERFAGYGFNKSHAVAYAKIVYEMAYLKSHYPKYFYRELLNSVIGDANKTIQYITEAKRKNIEMLYPSVNKSGITYLLDKNQIRLPLHAIKNVGRHTAQSIINERNNGLYKDYYDFVARCLLIGVNRSVIQQLIDGGALDEFGLSRRTMKQGLDEAITYGELVQIHKGDQITIDLGLVSKPTPIRLKDEKYELIENEKEALGFCLSTHPIAQIRAQSGIQLPTISEIKELNTENVRGFGYIQKVNEHRTKTGEMMAFLKISDETDEIDMAVMPKLYHQLSAQLIRGTYITFDGKISREDSVLANRIQIVRKN